MEWLNIETRPKEDMETFLVRVMNHDNEWCTVEVQNYEGRMYPTYLGCCIYYNDAIVDATHWQSSPVYGESL